MEPAYLLLPILLAATSPAQQGWNPHEGGLLKYDIASGRILGSMESPGHWLSLARNGDIYIASLTGNVFRWYPGWVAGVREEAPGVVK